MKRKHVRYIKQIIRILTDNKVPKHVNCFYSRTILFWWRCSKNWYPTKRGGDRNRAPGSSGHHSHSWTGVGAWQRRRRTDEGLGSKVLAAQVRRPKFKSTDPTEKPSTEACVCNPGAPTWDRRWAEKSPQKLTDQPVCRQQRDSDPNKGEGGGQTPGPHTRPHSYTNTQVCTDINTIHTYLYTQRHHTPSLIHMYTYWHYTHTHSQKHTHMYRYKHYTQKRNHKELQISLYLMEILS